MSSKEITLWINERWYEALSDHLEGKQLTCEPPKEEPSAPQMQRKTARTAPCRPLGTNRDTGANRRNRAKLARLFGR